jgi:Ala-tRNA(Pro) deacylase
MAKLGDLIDYINRNGVRYEVIEHAPAYSAHEVAVASHVAEKDLAKTLIAHSGDKYYMAVVPADHRLDEHLLRDVLNEKEVHLAHEQDLKPLFPDCEIGAMPPFGNLYALPVYIDKTLTNDKEIVFNACSHVKSIRLKMDDYIRIVKPVVADISRSRFDIEEK